MTTPAPAERASSPLGTYIRTRREKAGLSQQQLATLVGHSQMAISYWELGERIPSARAVVALARELPGASLVELLAILAPADEVAS